MTRPLPYINTGVQQPGKPSKHGGVAQLWAGESRTKICRPIPRDDLRWAADRSQALYSRLWGSGFLPSKHQGVKLT